jgi:hypothetical protein
MSARFITPVGALLLACLLAACGSSGSSGAFNPAGHPQTTAPTPAAPDADVPSAMSTTEINKLVLARYREFQRVYEKVYETNDPSLLSSIATDPLLGIIRNDVRKISAKGEIWRFHNVLNPRIQGRTSDGNVVAVLDCVRTLGAYRFSATTGKRLGAWRGGTYLYQAVMRYSGGTWKISEARQGKKC